VTKEPVYVALGSNLGDRAAHLAYARARLAALPGTQVLRTSSVEETAPLGPVPQGPYLNQMSGTSSWASCTPSRWRGGASGASAGVRAPSISTSCVTARARRPGPIYCCRTPSSSTATSGCARSPSWTPPPPPPVADAPKPVTVATLLKMKEQGERIVVLTCYDALFARLLDAAGVDVLLVGDSVNQILAGAETTLSATLEQMIYHTKIVRRGSQRALVVCDMPFLSYQVSREEAIRNCGRVLAETGCHAVKLEGGQPMVETVRALVDVGIPVMGHLGLTPQSVHALGGYRIQGRDAETAERLKRDATALEAAGAFAIVLELVPAPLASQISKGLTIPTIGIGAGPACDGQVLALPDMLGLNEQFAAKFVKRYAALAADVREAVELYAAEVREGRYPGPEHSFPK